MQRTRLFLFRHGQVEGFEEKRYNGQTNVALTELGREQSARICQCLAVETIAAVYCSDLDRSRYCAERVAADHGLAVCQHVGLRELHFGHWEERTWTELMKAYPDDWQARLHDLVNYRVPGGESLQDAADRIRPVLRGILAAHPDGDVVLVAHGGVNRIILLDAIGASLDRAFAIEQGFGCLNVIDYFADGNSVVRLLNGRAHLEPPCAP